MGLNDDALVELGKHVPTAEEITEKRVAEKIAEFKIIFIKYLKKNCTAARGVSSFKFSKIIYFYGTYQGAFNSTEYESSYSGGISWINEGHEYSSQFKIDYQIDYDTIHSNPYRTLEIFVKIESDRKNPSEPPLLPANTLREIGEALAEEGRRRSDT